MGTFSDVYSLHFDFSSDHDNIIKDIQEYAFGQGPSSNIANALTSIKEISRTVTFPTKQVTTTLPLSFFSLTVLTAPPQLPKLMLLKLFVTTVLNLSQSVWALTLTKYNLMKSHLIAAISTSPVTMFSPLSKKTSVNKSVPSKFERRKPAMKLHLII